MASASARVLVAEQDRLQLQLIDMLLSPGGFDLVMVQTGREALDYLKGATPECALLALDLPDMAGDAICGKIRSVSRLARLPVVLIAPQEGRFGLSEEARARAGRARANLVLPRPLGDKNLRERIRALVDAGGTPPQEDAEPPVREEHLLDLDHAPATTPEPDADDAPVEVPADALRTDPGLTSSVRDPEEPARPAAPDATPKAVPETLRQEAEALRLENQQLRRKLAEKQAALESGVNPPLQQRITDLERRNRALLNAIQELKGDRGEGRRRGLFGRRK